MSTCDLSFSLTSLIPIKEGQRLLIAPNWESSLKPVLGGWCVWPRSNVAESPAVPHLMLDWQTNRQTNAFPVSRGSRTFHHVTSLGSLKKNSDAPISGRNARWKRDRITRKSCYKKPLWISSPKSSAGFWQFALLSPIRLMFFHGCTFWCEIFKV